jgi:polynucleotide 5'-hydroxyl-kinase GRC3/NOL9
LERTVESGKTLLVDGPASVTMTSGKAEAFGSTISSVNKIVIREGKRLPFLVTEKTTFNISLGESSNVEEVDGSTIPYSWIKSYEELLKFQTEPKTAMVLGMVDSGKTSFCTYLINKLLHDKQKVAILDGDLGQSDIGPPCTVAYTFVAKPVTDLFSLKAENAFFVGATSPSGAIDKVIEGLITLKKKIFGNTADFILINTDGWVEGEDAVRYKIQLVEELKPDLIFCIQQKDELVPLLTGLGEFKKVTVDSPPAVSQRTREKRRNLRELGYTKYLGDSKIQSLSLGWLKVEGNELFSLGKIHGNIKQARKIYEILGMKPLHLTELQDKICIFINRADWIHTEDIKKIEEFTKKKVIVIRKGEERGLLIALYGINGKFLGIGVLQEIDYVRKTLKIFTPLAEKISRVAFGKVKLDKSLREIPTFAEENQ